MTNALSIAPGTSRTRAIVYRAATVITIAGMILGGASQLLRADYQVSVFNQLGYPLYLLSIIGSAKVLGGIVLLLPRLPLLKTWAYGGLIFVTIGAVVSHIAAGNPADAASPFIVAVITLVSCLMNPGIKFAAEQQA